MRFTLGQGTDPKTIRVVNRNLREEEGEATTTLRRIKKILREDLAFGVKGNPLKVDRTKHVIYDVKILGWKSKNKNRRYAPKGVDPTLYEGAVVNIDHPDTEEATRGPRPLSARFGEVTGIYKNEDGLFAKELHYIPTHPLCESILYMAEHKPHLFGCSQNAFGDVYEDATGEIVETVTDVRSIDLVSEPATTQGLYEGTQDDPAKAKPKKKTKKKVKEAEEDEPDGDEEPDAEAPATPPEEDGSGPEDDIPMGGPGETESPAPPPEAEGEEAGEDYGMGGDDTEAPGGGGGGIDITDETLSQLTKVLNADIDPKVKKKKVAAIVQHHMTMQEGVRVSAALKKLKTLDDAKRFLLESTDPAVKRAGKAVVGTLDNYEVREKVGAKRKLAESLCVRAKLPKDTVSDYFLSQLIECRDEKHMMEAIEDRRQLTGLAKSAKPRSAPIDGPTDAPLMEGTEEERTKKRESMEKAFLADVFREPVDGRI